MKKLTIKKALSTAILTVVLGGLLVLPVVVSAQGTGPTTFDGGTNYGLDQAGSWGLGTNDLQSTIKNVINILLGLLGIIAVLIILYGGFMWMTAAGNEDKVEKAKKLIISGIIGIIIILCAYTIAQFVIAGILNATQPTP
ncbi:MAG: hypothetical protein WC516_03100 [Patescibacteria group bacterium]